MQTTFAQRKVLTRPGPAALELKHGIWDIHLQVEEQFTLLSRMSSF